MTSPEDALAAVVREEWGRLTSPLLAQFRRLDLVEDALGDAVEAAARRWLRDGPPENPAGWLHTTARNLAANDRSQLSRGAHRLKGAAANIHALGLSQLAARLEKDANDATNAALAAQIEQLRELAAVTTEFLRHARPHPSRAA